MIKNPRNIYSYICTLLLLLVLLYIASYSKVDADVNNKQQIVVNTEWTETTNKKYNKLISLGFDSEVARSLITECKNTAKNANLCVKLGASILAAESTF